MEFGKIIYVSNGNGATRLKLTLVGQGDEDSLRREGLAGLRRKRIIRLTSEAVVQGSMLGYEDLVNLLMTSMATVKRDVNWLENNGHDVRIKGRRRNGVAKARDKA